MEHSWVEINQFLRPPTPTHTHPPRPIVFGFCKYSCPGERGQRGSTGAVGGRSSPRCPKGHVPPPRKDIGTFKQRPGIRCR